MCCVECLVECVECWRLFHSLFILRGLRIFFELPVNTQPGQANSRNVKPPSFVLLAEFRFVGSKCVMVASKIQNPAAAATEFRNSNSGSKTN